MAKTSLAMNLFTARTSTAQAKTIEDWSQGNKHALVGSTTALVALWLQSNVYSL